LLFRSLNQRLVFEYAPQPSFATGRPELADPATLAKTTEILKQIMSFKSWTV
jgi:hypothetical protein